MTDFLENAEHRIGTILDLKTRLFPDIWFRGSKSGRPLNLQIGKRPARYIRMILGTEDCLHLQAIEVYAFVSATLQNVAVQADLVTSSVYENTASLIENRHFNEGPKGIFGFHTKRELHPWALVDLLHPFDIERIVLYNRDDEWAARAWSINVFLSIDKECWQEVYNYKERLTEFRNVIISSHRYLNVSVEDLPKIQLIDSVVLAIYAGDYTQADDMLNEYGSISPLERDKFKQIINERLLNCLHREWTNHGIQRTFRFWSRQQKCDYLKFANTVISALQTLTPDVCFGFGSVLAVVRDKEFLKHDDDLDIIIALPKSLASKISSGLDLVSKHLEAKGFNVGGNHLRTHRRVWMPKQTAVDVFVGLYEEVDFICWYPGPRRNLRKDDLFPPREASLHDVKCLIPRRPIRYLQRVYGPNWRVPIPRWNHNWDKSTYSDIL